MMKINETQTELDLTEREDSKETSFIFSLIHYLRYYFIKGDGLGLMD